MTKKTATKKTATKKTATKKTATKKTATKKTARLPASKKRADANEARGTFRLKGRVVPAGSTSGVPELRVEAWDKDLICSDLIGSKATDSKGRFEMSFTSEYFAELFADRNPDLFFRVYSGTELLVSTEDSVLWNVRSGDTSVVIKVPEVATPARARNRFSESNEKLRMICGESPDEDTLAATRTFFRRLGAPHLYEERVLPILQGRDCWMFAAVEDRPWPPWGLGAQQIRALCVCRRTGAAGIGLSPVFVADEHVSNIGLSAAILREALTFFAEKNETVNFAAIEGSAFAAPALRAHSFVSTGDIFLTEPARYDIYSANPAKVLRSLGLKGISTLDLLTYDVDWDTLARNALFFSALQLATQPFIRDHLDRLRTPDINVLDWLGFDIAALPPGGVYS